MGKNHRYISFTERVASIRIDPIRRTGSRRIEIDDADTSSFFVTCMKHWNELNLSTSYTNFVSECSSLSESLPMILYNQKKIFDLLVDAIKKTDEHGAQPLFDLMVNFARDLGEDFEPFYPIAVETCVDTILRYQRNDNLLEIVELAFNCLASMFKFLARLISQNLVPTYDLLFPLFGGVKTQKQRQFILRFAAESMAFLLRRAQKGDHLPVIVDHIVKKVIEDKSNEQYVQSSMQLFADTLKGPGTTLHSKTPSLITAFYGSCRKFHANDLISHILVDVLHHAREDTAKPLYDTLIPLITEEKTGCDVFATRCLYIITGLRKGDRVSDFGQIYDAVITLSSKKDVATSLEWIQAASAAILFSSKITLAQYLDKVLNCCPDSKTLFKLIESINAFDHEIAVKLFGSRKYLKTFTAKMDKGSINDLKELALIMYDIPVLREFNEVSELNLVKNIKLYDNDGGTSLFNLWWMLIMEPASEGINKDLLKSVLKLNFEYSEPLRSLQSNVVAFIVENITLSSKTISEISSKMVFTSKLMDRLKIVISASSINRIELLSGVKEKIYSCLMSCDKSVRGSALNLLKVLIIDDKNSLDSHSLLDQCFVINDIPLDLENVRNVSHRLRQLASKFNLFNKSLIENSTSKLEEKVIVEATLSFILGMLTTRLQPVWQAVVSIMPKIAESAAELLCEKLMIFIEENGSQTDNASSFMIDQGISSMEVEDDVPIYQHVDCNTLDNLQTCTADSWSNVENVTESLESKVRSSLEVVSYGDLRSLGIKALCEIPQDAEKYCVKQLVPYLLTARDDEETGFDFKDQVSLLELFSKLRKPQNLPQFSDVFKKYLYFLSSRHSPLQKLGLKCLLTTNTPEVKIIRKYRDNFEMLLDDKRFSDELTGFICTGDYQKDETSLHPDDKDTVMPFVIRILYGRAQNSTKRNMRHTVMSSLLFFDQKSILMFISLAHEHLHEVEAIIENSKKKDDADFDAMDVEDVKSQEENNDGKIERDISRKYQGYLSLIHDFIHHLKGASENCIPVICEEGIFPILSKINLHDDKGLRQSITKDLDEMLSSVPKRSIWESLFPFIREKLIEPQLDNYGLRNLENLSTVAKLVLTLSTEVELVGFIDESISLSILSCLGYDSVKETVIANTLKIVINLTTNAPESPVTRSSISYVVQVLPPIMERELSPDTFGLVVNTVNKVFALGVDSFDATVVKNLAEVSFNALQKPSRIIPLHIKGSLLMALSQILSSPSCSIEIIHRAYDTLAPLFRQFAAPDARTYLSSCYKLFGERVPSYKTVGDLIVELNSYDNKRLGEPDFERRGAAFELLNEKIWVELSSEQWMPLVQNMLFYIRDPDELALRNYGKYALMRAIESSKAREIVNTYVLPAIKRGLRDEDEKFRRTYIDLLGQCAKFDVLPTLNILLYNGDEEADFFININHIQVHRRRRAIQRLAQHAGELDENVIAHYLLSIVEHFAYHSGSKNDDLNNLADDALHAITELLRHVSEGQFKSVARRCVKEVKLNPEPAKIRKAIRIVTSVAQATPSGIDDFVLNVLVDPLYKILSEKSNEHENLPDRVPISVAIIYFMKSLSEEVLTVQLPGKLVALCQLLRSKIPEMRDTVRQSLSRIIKALGTKYLLFVVSELSSALNRGGLQSHVLGFTVHSLLVELNREGGLKVGDTDDSADLIFNIVMKDTFGSTGDEKDEEGYVTSAKEVKQNKSYDTAEILASSTSISQFGKIFIPMRNYLSSTKLSPRGEHKVSEVLRRLASGLHRNPLASTQDAVVMGYEIFTKCNKALEQIVENSSSKRAEKISENLAARLEAAKESEEYFTVRLSSRDWYESPVISDNTDRQLYNMRYARVNFHLLQTFALDTLRSVLTSTSGGATSDEGKGLLTIANAKGLMPVIVQAFESTHEDMNMAALKLATTVFRLPIYFAEGDDTLEILSKRTLYFIESSPDTNNLLCQAALKFMTVLLRSRPEFELSAGSIAYILERITPDLEEPERQGTAISFLRAIFARQAMLPQIYDAADTLSRVMVTNQSDHIRVNCRAAYLQFLTTYPLGQTRLNRHLKFLGSNVQYSAASGRLSVMEMIESLLKKVDANFLEGAMLQWYLALVLAVVSDADTECRNRASSLLELLISHTKSDEVFNQMVDHCISWLKSLGKNNTLVRAGLKVAKLFLRDNVVAGTTSETSKANLETLKKQELQTVSEILKSGVKGSDKKPVDWQLIDTALETNVSSIMDLVIGVMLFPHQQVRARAARVFGQYFKDTPKDELSLDMLTEVGVKLVRQLGAPQLSNADTLQIVKDLVFIIPIWDSSDATRISKNSVTGEETKVKCVDWLVTKLSSLIRTDISDEDHVGTKTGAIQILAALPSLLKPESTEQIAGEAIRCLFILNDQLTAEDTLEDLRNLAEEALSFYDKALGTTEYLKKYSAAKRFVDDRRRLRRSKRSIQAVSDPVLAAQKKIKKNAHKREVRKNKKHAAERLK